MKQASYHVSDGTNVIMTQTFKNDLNNPTKRYYTANNIGSTVMLTDKTGEIVEELLYHPFGEKMLSLGNSEATRLFTGQQLDKETGLYYYNTRYYDPETAVFTRPDPAKDGLNHYNYVSGNPINYVDPTGMEAWEINKKWDEAQIKNYRKTLNKALKEEKMVKPEGKKKKEKIEIVHKLNISDINSTKVVVSFK